MASSIPASLRSCGANNRAVPRGACADDADRRPARDRRLRDSNGGIHESATLAHRPHVLVFRNATADLPAGLPDVYSEEFLFYFNSYYEGFGARIERPKRGTKSRPTVKDTVAYRNHIDEQMLRFLDTIESHSDAETILSLVRLGLEHEMQHQELLVYDIKHLLCDQFDAPMKPRPKPVGEG